MAPCAVLCEVDRQESVRTSVKSESARWRGGFRVRPARVTFSRPCCGPLARARAPESAPDPVHRATGATGSPHGRRVDDRSSPRGGGPPPNARVRTVAAHGRRCPSEATRRLGRARCGLVPPSRCRAPGISVSQTERATTREEWGIEQSAEPRSDSKSDALSD